MSIKRHIAILNSHLSHWRRLLENKICDIDEGRSTIEALKMAIELLESEPCDDCISRERAVYVASGYCHPQNIADELRKLPSVVPQPRTGHWIKIHWKAFRCSECSKVSEYNTDFCPNCGAIMVDVSDINDGKMSEGDE